MKRKKAKKTPSRNLLKRLLKPKKTKKTPSMYQKKTTKITLTLDVQLPLLMEPGPLAENMLDYLVYGEWGLVDVDTGEVWEESNPIIIEATCDYK